MTAWPTGRGSADQDPSLHRYTRELADVLDRLRREAVERGGEVSDGAWTGHGRPR